MTADDRNADVELTPEDEKLAEEKTKEMLEFFAQGGTIGDLAGFGSDEYEAIYSLAYNFMEAHKYEKATELLRFLVVADPVESRWYYALGVAEQGMDHFDVALDAYSMAAVLNATDPLPQLQGGFCLMALGKYKEAAEALDGAMMASEGKTAYADVHAQAKALLDTVRGKLGGGKEKA